MRNTSIAAVFVSTLLISVSAVAEDKPLRSGIDATFAPHAMPRAAGGIQGFNVDLIDELSKELGRKIQLDAVQFSGLIPGLQSGVYDFIAAPVTVNKERADSLLFTEGYINTDFQFTIRKGSPQLKSLDDLKGKTISVNKGSTYDLWARNLAEKHGWTVESYGTTTDAMQAVVSGRAYANLAGNTAAAWAVKNSPALELSLIHSTGLVFSMPVRKDNTQMRAMLENAIECLKQKGIIAKLHEKWFGTVPAADSPSVKIYAGLGVPGMPGYDAKEHKRSCK